MELTPINKASCGKDFKIMEYFFNTCDLYLEWKGEPLVLRGAYLIGKH